MNPADDETSRSGDWVYYLAAIGVGALTGALGSVLHLGTDRVLEWPRLLRSYLEVSPAIYPLVTGAIAALLTVIPVWLVRTFAPEAGGSGVQEIEGAMEGLRAVRWLRVLFVKFFGGFLALGSGLVIGREGPTIHIGASIAQAFSEGLRTPTRESRGLLAAGGAAGLTAAFGAPLASILFVIEETRRQFPYTLKTYTALMLACVTSGIMTEVIAGRRPFMAMVTPETPVQILPAFVVLGLLLGAFGVVFNRALVWSLDMAHLIGQRTTFYIVPVVVGFAVGALLILRPEATMGGENLAMRLVSENLALTIIGLIVATRFVMTMASYSTGVPGGIFAPILSLATAFGLLYGVLLSRFLPMPPGSEATFAVAAMGGLFSSTIRAPLVGIVLIAELTGSYTSFIPAILTCLFANLIAESLGGRPIYEVLLDRTLALEGKPRSKPCAPAGEAIAMRVQDQP